MDSLGGGAGGLLEGIGGGAAIEAVRWTWT